MATTNHTEGKLDMEIKRDWFTIAEAANAVGASYHSFYRWIDQGRVWAETAGKGIHLVHQSEIDELRRHGNRPASLRRYRSRDRVSA